MIMVLVTRNQLPSSPQTHNLSQCISEHIERFFNAHNGDLPTNGIMIVLLQK